MNFFKKNIEKKYWLTINGQLLIETLVALGILTTGFLGILGLLSRSLSLNRVISEQYQANYLAAEGIEIIKNVIDQNAEQGVSPNQGLSDGCFEVVYNQITNGLVSNFKYPGSFISSCSNNQSYTSTLDPIYLHADTGFYDYEALGGTITPFKRYVEISNSANEITVESYVAWISRGGGQYEVNLKDNFYNWRSLR